jgi:hypothetical protein
VTEANYTLAAGAINCTDGLTPATALTSEVRYYLSNSLAPSTKRAYAAGRVRNVLQISLMRAVMASW